MLDDMAAQAQQLMRRAKEHDVELGNEHMLIIVRKLVDRLDRYREETVPKPRLII